MVAATVATGAAGAAVQVAVVWVAAGWVAVASVAAVWVAVASVVAAMAAAEALQRRRCCRLEGHGMG